MQLGLQLGLQRYLQEDVSKVAFSVFTLRILRAGLAKQTQDVAH